MAKEFVYRGADEWLLDDDSEEKGIVERPRSKWKVRQTVPSGGSSFFTIASGEVSASHIRSLGFQTVAFYDHQDGLIGMYCNVLDVTKVPEKSEPE